MRLSNKLNQLILGYSGKPYVFDVTHVNLRKDGTLTGKANGKPVKCAKLNNNMIWEYR